MWWAGTPRAPEGARSPLALALALALATLLSSGGCYYGHLAVGQTRLLLARRDVESVLADPATDHALRDRLELVERTRRFALDLGLDVEGQYTSYVPWPGDRVITSLVATRPGSVEAHEFEFPIIGRAPYKGYFDLARAQADAEAMRREGMDVCLHAISAYSTLGWFDDPLTAPMLDRSDGQLVETILHELVHATVFIPSQPDFNEGVASFLGQEASVLFFAARSDAVERRRSEVADARRLSRELLAYRARVRALYAEALPEPDRRAARERLEEDARNRIAALTLETRDAGEIARNARLGDACMALSGTYAGDLEHHATVLERLDGDLRRFLARLREVVDAEDPRSAFFADAPVTP